MLIQYYSNEFCYSKLDVKKQPEVNKFLLKIKTPVKKQVKLARKIKKINYYGLIVVHNITFKELKITLNKICNSYLNNWL